MRLKPIPEAPNDLEVVERAQRAVPLVPGSEDDCCARLLRRIDLESRDEARTWLTFLRTLGLVEKGTNGFTRTRTDVERDPLASAFRERVFGAREVLDAMAAADGPLAPDGAFEAVEPAIPEWERNKNAWQRTWRERARRLLAWTALLGLAERVDGGYRPHR